MQFHLLIMHHPPIHCLPAKDVAQGGTRSRELQDHVAQRAGDRAPMISRQHRFTQLKRRAQTYTRRPCGPLDV